MFKKFIKSVLKPGQPKRVRAQLETDLLNKVPFLEDADSSLIEDLAAAIDIVVFKKGEMIFKEGEPGNSFFLVADGSVEVSCKDEFIATLGVGGCFGEAALLSDDVRGATVTAAEGVTLYQIKRVSFTKLEEKYLKLRYRLKELQNQRRAEGIEKSIKSNLLENAPFLASADSALIQEIAGYLEPKKYAEGEVLIREGEEGTTFFLIEEGFVDVSKEGSQVADLGPGACIGEGSLITNRACSATVTARTETSCFVLGKPAFRRLISRYPVFGKRMNKIYAERS